MLQTEAGDDRHAFMADLIGRVDSDTEARLLGAIESDAPDQAAQVRKLRPSPTARRRPAGAADRTA